MIKRKLGVLVAAMSLALVAAAVYASAASAALKVEAKDFTEPVETSLGENLPVIVGFIAAIFAVTMVIGWIRKRAKEAKS